MKYLIYCRKSSESEEKQMLSIPAQENELAKIAEREGYHIAAKYQESMSAKRSGRPVFNQMLRSITKSKGVSLLVWNIDRLARNMVDGGMLLQLMDEGRIVEIRTYEKTYRNTPDDKFMMGLSFGMAKKYVDDLSVNVKRGNREKLARGEWPCRAPLGYLNNKANHLIDVDHDRAPYIKRAFELYATGGVGLNDLTKRLYDEGFRTLSGRKVYRSGIHRILQNPFYTGVMRKDGKLYDGIHQPLVSKKLFDDVQYALSGRAHPNIQKHFFPLRGFMTCATCGCMLTASLKKGHQYYHCTNGKRTCHEHKKYLREKYLYPLVAGIFDDLAFTERKIELMYRSAKEETEDAHGESRQALVSLQKRLQALPAQESRLLDTFLAEQISKELYDQKVAGIQHERLDLSKQIERLEAGAPLRTLEPTKEVFLDCSRAKKEFVDADEAKKRAIVEKLLWNLFVEDGKIVQVQYKSPYHAIAKAPKNGSILEMRALRESNPQ
jgi:site-specific DNA recombinase